MNRIVGLGIDIVEIGRIEKALQRWGDSFENRILTRKEQAIQESRTSSRSAFIAGRFAAKEAVFKALGHNPGWHAVEIVSAATGQPLVQLASWVAASSGQAVSEVLVSISHCRAFAVAHAMAFSGENI